MKERDISGYNFSDPIDRKVACVEDFFERYGITTRLDFNEIMKDMYILILLNDRVDAVSWALKYTKVSYFECGLIFTMQFFFR